MGLGPNSYRFSTLHCTCVIREKKSTLQQFYLVIWQLLEHNIDPRSKPRGGKQSSADLEIGKLRLTLRHFPTLVPSTEKKLLSIFAMCTKTQREQKHRDLCYQCAEYDVELCVGAILCTVS